MRRVRSRTAPQHGYSPATRVGRKLFEKPRLANPGLAAHDDQSLAELGPYERVVHAAEQMRARDKWSRDRRRRFELLRRVRLERGWLRLRASGMGGNLPAEHLADERQSLLLGSEIELASQGILAKLKLAHHLIRHVHLHVQAHQPPVHDLPRRLVSQHLVETIDGQIA